MSFFVYDSMRTDLLNGQIDFNNGTFGFKLMSSDYVPNIKTDTNFSEIYQHEVSGGGYHSIYDGFVIEPSNLDNKTFLKKTQLLWETIDVSFKSLVCCDQSSGKLIFCYGFSDEKVISNQDYRVQWPNDIVMELR